MTFSSLFPAYLTLVALGATAIAQRWLAGRARSATIGLLVVWLAYAGTLGGIATTRFMAPLALALHILAFRAFAAPDAAPFATPRSSSHGR